MKYDGMLVDRTLDGTRSCQMVWIPPVGAPLQEHQQLHLVRRQYIYGYHMLFVLLVL